MSELKRSAESCMKALLITIGCLLIVGGAYSIRYPRALVVPSTGPADGRDYAVPVDAPLLDE